MARHFSWEHRLESRNENEEGNEKAALYLRLGLADFGIEDDVLAREPVSWSHYSVMMVNHQINEDKRSWRLL
jgi:hypothetical protein